ncbi:MAG: serine/threonine-protein kinase, partial [Planctomycetota bacterium]
MSATSTHPTDQHLRDYIKGLLDDELSEVINAHVESCERCSRRLDGLSKDEATLVCVIQSVWDSDAIPSPLPQRSDNVADLNAQTLAIQDNEAAIPHAGKYEIVEELGRGGMGVVYRAVDRELKREVALKVIIAGEHSSGSQRERFRREAETIARLRHPGIVQIYEVGDFGDQPFLALELVAGPNLSQVTRNRQQPIEWSTGVTLQLSQAIHYAHQQSVIHRDLKPGNVLVALTEEVEESGSGINDFGASALTDVPETKITDFGLAKQLDSDEHVTKTGQSMGTPAYMSPEQAAGQTEGIGPATDIYALGVILYELLTGRPPLEGPDPVSTMLSVMEQDPVPLRNHRSEIPRDLETICMKCLMKKPEDRYESARDLGQDLELFLNGEPILARRPSVIRRIYRWARNHPQLAIAYLACVVCYGMHLVAKHFLKLPFHVDSFGAYAPLLFFGFAAFATLCEALSRRFERLEIGQYGFIAITVIWMSIMFTFDKGPRSSPITLFPVLIASSILLVPRSTMIWFTASVTSICYIAVAIHAHRVSGRGVVSLDEAIGFVGSLIMTGVCMQLILRRASRRTVRDNQWKSNSGSSRFSGKKAS